MIDAAVLLAALGAALAVMVGTWLLSLRMRDASIADIAWGLVFVAIAWIALAVGDGSNCRALLLAGLTTLWGIRLAAFIAWRHQAEDPRYVAMRRKHGATFAVRSLWSVFVLQAFIAWIVSLPIQIGATDPSPSSLGVLAAVGTVFFAFGLFFEAVSDQQLQAFKSDPANKGQVMDRGLWRYSRHPNYFGEVCLWWGIWLVACDSGSAWWTAIGPALITFMLLRVSGVTLTERTITSRRPGYTEYIRRTSAFIPRPPRD